MTLPTATKNNRLNGQTYDFVSLHDGYPGSTGTSELSGGGYAKVAIVVNAASGGQRALNALVNVTVPACTVRYLGFWNGAVFADYAPNGGATPKNFTASVTGDTIHSGAHGWSDTQKFVFIKGTAPTGLTAGVVYFVRDATADTFKVAATSGGAAINLTANPSYGCQMCAITEDVYASPGAHTVSTGTFIEPD